MRIEGEGRPDPHGHSLRVSLTLSLLLFLPGLLAGQSANAFLDSSANRAVGMYTASLGINSRLYNGSQYRDYDLHEYDSGHAYFQSDDWTRGKVHYDGQHFENVSILYNLVTDRVIVENPYNSVKIELLTDRVADFDLGEHHFVRLTLDNTSLFSRNGFYEELYNGMTRAYCRRSKDINLRIEVGRERKNFIEKRRYYIWMRNDLQPVTSKSSLYRLLEDRKADLKKGMSRNPFSYRKQRGQWIAWVTRSYDELSDKP